jgi:hypothetical protein
MAPGRYARAAADWHESDTHHLTRKGCNGMSIFARSAIEGSILQDNS